MGVGQSRYDTNPNRLQGQKDIITHVLDLGERITTKEKSLQIGHTAIEDGDLTVRNGYIVVSETDDTIVMRLKHGAIPEIQFFPLGDNDTHKATLFGQDFNNDANNPNQAIQLDIELLDNTIDGGKLLLMRDGVILSHQPDGGQESFIWLNSLAGISEEVIAIRGAWPNQLQYDSHAALHMGDFVASSGFSTWTYTYSTPFATNMVPLFTIGVNGGTLTWGIDSYSTSSFVIRFGVTANNKFVTFWNFRCDI